MLVEKIYQNMQENGIKQTAKKAYYKILLKTILSKYYIRNKSLYNPPNSNEIFEISRDIHKRFNAVKISLDPKKFSDFIAKEFFSKHYHGGSHSPIWRQKLLEHYLTWEELGLDSFQKEEIYIDVASANSPWANKLHEHANINSFAIDLLPRKAGIREGRYLQMDATDTNFSNNSVAAMSLQCAFEMFSGDADINLIKEAARILKPGGKLLISPLYLHTHACYYSTVDYYDKKLGDTDAKQYLRLDVMGIPASRKYSIYTLQSRIISKLNDLGLSYKILEITNLNQLGTDLYLNFALVIEKTNVSK